MPKENFIPIENKKPVEEVRFWDYKEIKKSPLSLAARSKVISRHSSDYLSSRAINSDIAVSQMYGPGFWDDVRAVVYPVSSGTYVKAATLGESINSSFSLTLNIANEDRHYDYVFEFRGDIFSSHTLYSLSEAREWARKLGNGEVKVIDTKHNNSRDMSYEKRIKESLEEVINNNRRECERGGYQVRFSRIS